VSRDKSQSAPDGEGKNDLKKRILSGRRPRPAFFVLLLLVIISAGYYTLYYFNHSDDLRDYYLRSLLVSTDNTEQEIERLWHNVDKNLGETGKIGLIPAFESATEDECNKLEPQTTEQIAKEKHKINKTVAGWIGGQTVLCFFGSDASTVKTPPAKLATLLESKLPIEDFDSILLTRQNGDVLLLQQHQNMAVDIVRLDITELRDFDAITSESGNNPVDEMTLEHTAIGEFSFAETSYLAFVQPLRIPIELDWKASSGNSSDNSGEVTWFLIGLKEKGRFRAEAMAISPTVLLIILSVVILALFALPYLKLRFIGSREALHKHDVLVLTTTLMIAISSITLALLELQMRDTQQQELDKRLDLIAEDISDKFNAEVSSVDSQLRMLTALKSQPSSPAVPWTADTMTNMQLVIVENDRILPEEQPLPQMLPLVDYPFLEMAYWMDQTGEQKQKWSIKNETTSLINVSGRDYFKNARDLRFTNSRFKLETEPGWVLESLRSKNTGEVSSVLSHHVAQEGDEIVAAIYSPLLSVIEPLLPPGFEFAIIDDQGNVLFHQDPTRNLSENLFDWVDKEDSLRASIWARNKSIELDVNYRARDYRAHIQPLRSTPWSLVVLYDVLDSRQVRVDILTVAFFLYLVYLIAFLVMYFYLWARTSETLKNPFFVWLWPDRSRVHIYQGFLLIAAINVIVWSILFLQGSHNGFVGQSGVVALSALLGLVTFGFSYRLLRLSNPNKYQSPVLDSGFSRLRPFGWYVITLITAMTVSQESLWVLGSASVLVLAVLHVISTKFSRPTKFKGTHSSVWHGLHLTSLCAIVGVIAVLPTFIFYGVAHDEIMELSAKRDQLNWSEALGKRYERYLEKYQGIAMHPGSEMLIREQLQFTGDSDLGDAWDIHGVDGQWTARESSSTHVNPQDDLCDAAEEEQPSSSRILMFAASLVPGYTAESYELRSLAKAEPGGTWCWRYSSDDSKPLTFIQRHYRHNFTLGSDSRPIADDKFINLELGSPRIFFKPPDFRTITWVIALLVALALVVVTRNLLRLVYLMDLRAPAFMNGDCWPKTHNRQHTLVLRGSEKNGLINPDEAGSCMIDTSRMETDEDVDRLLNLTLATDHDTVCLTQFHIGLWDPQVANRKLLLLEKLLTSGSRLTVHSDINPLHFFLMRSRDYLRGLADSEPDLGRWVAVLAEFTRCRPIQNQDGLLDRLKTEQPGPNSEKTTRALRLLADECWTSNELEEIAEIIVRHPGFNELAEAVHFPEAIINQVLDQAEPYYRILWAISSKDERMVLYHVAVHGFVSWRSIDVVRRLINRGLIQMAPHPRLMNRSFWQFVRHAEMPEVLEQWTEEAGASGWARLKGPVSIAVVLAIAFLFSTQPQLLKQGIAFTAILAAGAPALVKLFSMLVQTRLAGGSKD